MPPWSTPCPSDPTAEVELDLATFVALTNGRGDPASALDDDRVQLSGDVELGRSVVEHLSFMS